jgi:diacylglycerol kinase family enzyme
MNARAGAKRLLGPWAFALEAWRVILRHPFPQVRVTIGDGQYCGYDVVIGKSRLYGGWMQVTPGADVGAPSFQVAICRGRRVLPYFVYVARALAGTLQRSPDHVFLSCSRLTVESDGEVLVQADGDLLGRLPMTFEIDGAAVEALTAAAAAAP